MWLSKKDEELERIDREIPAYLKIEKFSSIDKENNTNGNQRTSHRSSIKKAQEESLSESKNIVEVLTKAKNQANEKFKEAHYKEAIDGYNKITKEIESQLLLESKSNPALNTIKEVYVTSLSNCVQSYINIKDYDMAILLGKKALSIDQSHVKSYFRTGKAMR